MPLQRVAISNDLSVTYQIEAKNPEDALKKIKEIASLDKLKNKDIIVEVDPGEVAIDKMIKKHFKRMKKKGRA